MRRRSASLIALVVAWARSKVAYSGGTSRRVAGPVGKKAGRINPNRLGAFMFALLEGAGCGTRRPPPTALLPRFSVPEGESPWGTQARWRIGGTAGGDRESRNERTTAAVVRTSSSDTNVGSGE